MSTIYLIPGLGADSRAYKNIHLAGHDVVLVDWIEPEARDTLTSYAKKLISQYGIISDSVIIGNSMGGIIAIEIAKLIGTKKTIIISSIKTDLEAPWYFYLFRKVPVHKLVPGGLFSRMGYSFRVMFGKMSKADATLFADMLEKTSPRFAKWAMGAILDWRNTEIPPNVYHITGNNDLIFSYRRIKDAQIIDKGTHLMIVNKADEINKLLQQLLAT